MSRRIDVTPFIGRRFTRLIVLGEVPESRALSQFDMAAVEVQAAIMTRPKRPRDTNQLAKMIVDLTTRTATEIDPDAGKDAKAVARGRRGGVSGGAARAAALSPDKRALIAKRAADARWKSRKKEA